MAISYEQVGWDTTSYVNPTNMNQMDDGIKAACDGVDELDSTKLDLAGGTMTGTLTVNNTDTFSRIVIGGAGNTERGVLNIYNGDYYATVNPVSLTANRTITLPDAAGTVALTSNLPQWVTTYSDTPVQATVSLTIPSGFTPLFHAVRLTDSSGASTTRSTVIVTADSFVSYQSINMNGNTGYVRLTGKTSSIAWISSDSVYSYISEVLSFGYYS